MGDTQLGTSELVELFTRSLGHDQASVREAACMALGVLGRPGCVPILARILHDEDEGRSLTRSGEIPRRMRVLAAYGIGLTGRRTHNIDVRRYAVHELLRAIDQADEEVEKRLASVIALGLVAPARREHAGAGYGPGLRPAGCPCATPEALVHYLVALFDERGEERLVRAHLATTLARWLPAVSRELRDEVTARLVATIARSSRASKEVRQSVAQALGVLGDCDDDPLDERIREALIRTAGRGDQLARRFALIALARIGAGPDLLRELARAKSNLRPWLALATGVLGDALLTAGEEVSPDVLDALRLGLERARSPDDVAAFAIANGLCRSGEGAHELLARSRDLRDDATRAHLATAMGLTRSAGLIDGLQHVLAEADHRPATMAQCVLGLRLLGDRALLGTLLEPAEGCACLASRVATALALGCSRDRRAVEPLLTMLADEEAPELLRAWVVTALGLVADADDRPFTAWLSHELNYACAPASLTARDGTGFLDLP